uniref:CHAT domain-containing protein n=1 Tax=Eiseniibacteriota bacterium TaxID=2212470 RepID=A0A832I4H1_UNCEI
MYWSYVARNRRRWAPAGAPHRTGNPLAERLTEAQIEALAAAALVEVSVPAPSRAPGRDATWAGRVMPWEYLLSDATRRFRRPQQEFAVVRHLAAGGAPAARDGLLDRVAVVQSAPGALAESYDVSSETRLVLAGLGLDRDSDRVRVLENPAPERLAREIASHRPGLVHVAGMDTRQALELLGAGGARGGRRGTGAPGDGEARDGMALSDGRGGVRFERAEALAPLLAGVRPAPGLVAFNLYNSASRIAPQAVLAGAAHAIGFLDTMDDRLAEQFFASFYRALAHDAGDVCGAFRAGLRELRRNRERLRGACVVLWSAASVVERAPAAARRRAPPAADPPAEAVAPRDRILVECAPPRELNYALLQNGRPPLEKLQIVRGRVSGPIRDIAVSVTLFVGEAPFPFRRLVELPDGATMLDLTDEVVVPLTAALIRTQGETVLSVAEVEVACAGAVVHRRTYRMPLVPVDQWKDTEADRRWLPSFVLPRDPAVARIVQSAQRYLAAIADDPAAGFDGYQGLGPPDTPVEERCRSVDGQARAIWTAIVTELRLTYVQPPPSYRGADGRLEEAVQRLRTPSEIARARHATCMDLALLLAACLEYVDLWPAIILTEGHALVGYWRAPEWQEAFQALADVDPAGLERAARSTVGSARDEVAYVLPCDGHWRVADLIGRGRLVPLEATLLAGHRSFADARREGAQRIADPLAFHALIDVVRARDEGVTPLPILWRPE